MKKNLLNLTFAPLSYTLILSAICLFLPFMQVQGQSSPTSFKVEVVGKGPAMILIPGLSCSGEVWDETVARYKDSYQCHVLTLAGFAGQPPIDAEHFLDRVRQELAAYIRQQKLHKPVVVGHSLGGTLALWLGAKEPELPGALLIVDSAPFLPALINPAATLEGAKAMAEGIRKNVQSQTKEQLRQTQPQVLSTMISDEVRIAQAAEWNYASDPNTVGQAVYELYTMDLREEIGNIKAPTLVMAAWIAYKGYGATHESTEIGYNSQYKNLPNYELVVNDQARHFIMWDDPEGFYTTMDRFLVSYRK